MPRQSRIDAPGVLHHVIIRGIERRKIFRDDHDKENFVNRLSVLIPETQTICYAWTLMSNHAHFIFRSGTEGISNLMRRLLTGYAVTFNKRYNRHGQLFQNRYKSIICQEDTYLKELIRYIHLNPLRANMVQDLKELKEYRFCGHGVLMGKRTCDFQDDKFILSLFSGTVKQARKNYLSFVKAGQDQGRRPELVGGGLIRSLGGWDTAKKILKKGMERQKGDQRILGDTDFVLSILKKANEKLNRKYELKEKGIDLDYIAKKVGKIYEIDPDDIFLRGRQFPLPDARGLYCYWAVNELKISLKDLSEKIGITPSGIGYAVQRGQRLARKQKYQLID